MPRLRGKITITLIILILAASLAACAPAQPAAPAPAAQQPAAAEPAAPAAEPAAPAAEPAAEETQIIIGTLGEAETLNPILANQSESGWRTMMLFDPLVELHPVTFEPVGRLATDWEISEDGLTYTFHLRHDSQWHDGEPVTAADVEFAVLSMLSPDYTGPNYSRWNGIVGAEAVHDGSATECEGVEVIDDYTIAFHLAEANAPFLVDTLAADVPLMPLPKHLLEGQDLMNNDYNVAPVGNGPYKFVSWEIGDAFVMEANPDWWGGEPKIKKVIHRNIPDSQTLVVALEAGEIDGSLYALPTVADRLVAKDNLRVMVVPFDYPNGFKYNLDHPVLQDVAIRQAIAHAVDSVTFADEFLLGLGTPGIGPVAPGIWAFNENLEIHAYDIELAKKILDDAGWVDSNGDGIRDKDGVEAVIVGETNAGNVMREDFCTYTQGSVIEIGIDWKCEFKEWSVIVNDATTGTFEAIMPQWSGASVEPHELYRSFHTNGSNNVGHYSNAEVDQLLEEGRVTVDMAKRKAIYDRVQEIIMEELPVSYPWYRPFIHVIDTQFDGDWIVDSRLYGGCFRNLYDWEMAQ